MKITLSSLLLAALSLFASCGDDGTAADHLGVGAECAKTESCQKDLSCLTGFKGGYCGLSGCAKDADCPSASACVAEAGTNYCFRICSDKSECNANRTVDFAANCSSNVTFVEAKGVKACVPPS